MPCYDDHVVRATHSRLGIEIPTAIRFVNQTVRVRYHPRHVDNGTIKVNKDEITCELSGK